jgi:glycosyltransferase involved in cell wall biosynthesis
MGDEEFHISVVVPCLNEEDNVEPVYKEIVAELGRYGAIEILFVDDGSTDKTLDRVRTLAERDPAVSYVSFTRNFGLEAAFSAGYRYARYPWILHLDADLQFPPSEAHRLIDAARSGLDAVFGVRVNRQDSALRRASSALHGFLATRVLGIELPPGATTFRLVRADLARRIVDLGLGTPYFLATVPRLTSAWTTVPTAHRRRERGSVKVTVRGLARHAIELFYSFSVRPITYATMACFAAAVLAFGAGAVAVLPSGLQLAVVLEGLALGGGLLAIAIIARYLVHIGRGQPGLPMFLIREANVSIRPEDLFVAPASTS